MVITQNEAFTISIALKNAKYEQLSSFPDLIGFTKYGRYTETYTDNSADGESVEIERIVQPYYAQQPGVYEIPSFAMNINDEVLQQPAFTITVNPPNQSGPPTQNLLIDPEDPFLSGEEAVEVEDAGRDVFLAVTANKEEVFVGEGFNFTLALYVANNTPKNLEFVRISQQLNDLLKRIKPASCWEEDFNIDRLYPVEVRIDEKVYDQYKLYQASYFPFNTDTINIPAVQLNMIDNNYPEEEENHYVNLISNPKTILVKPLPPHPMRDRVMVGDFYLDEKASTLKTQTGESFTYNFAIVGDGNIVNIPTPQIVENDTLDFYPPTTRQVVKRINNRVTGAKVFGHYVVAQSPGTVAMRHYFRFIYFSLSKQDYDTLYPKTIIEVKGAKLNKENSNLFGDFYGKLEKENNTLTSLHTPHYTKLYINIFMLVVLLATLVSIFVNRQKR
ncbi:MAG: BatD family protein [Thermonemataceae bacterium]